MYQYHFIPIRTIRKAEDTCETHNWVTRKSEKNSRKVSYNITQSYSDFRSKCRTFLPSLNFLFV